MQLDIRYLKAVQIGSFVVARCSNERKGRSVNIARATAFVGSWAITSANGIWKITRCAGKGGVSSDGFYS